MKLAQAKIVVLSMTVAGALCVIGMCAFLIAPMLSDISSLAGKIVAAASEVQAQYNYRKQLSDTVKRLKQSKAAVGELSTQFVPQGSELTFITAIEGIGENDGVQARLSLTPGGNVDGAPEFDRGFSVDLSGSFRNVMHALVDIERLPQLTVLSSLNAHGGSSGSGQDAQFSLSVTGSFASPPDGL